MRKIVFGLFTVLALATISQKATAQDNDYVAVYRWLSNNNEFVTLAEGEIQEGQLLQWRYKEKTFLFYAYKTPAPDRVAVYRWTNPVTNDQMSVAEDELTDADMNLKGYTLKTLQFYAPIRRDKNHIAVYRWYKRRSKDWVTIPEFGDTNKYSDKGYDTKTFQYYGVMRNER